MAQKIYRSAEAREGVTVTSPYDVQGQINTSRTTAFASIDATIRSQTDLIALGNQIREIGKPYAAGDLRIEYGGNIFAGFELPASEAYGLLAAIIILVLSNSVVSKVLMRSLQDRHPPVAEFISQMTA